GILNSIRESAAFGNRADTMLVVTQHVVRIQRERCLLRSILPDPFEAPNPVVACCCTGPFDVRRCRKQLPLCKPHPEAKRHEQNCPSPGMPLQDVSTEQAAAENKQERIQQMETAHRLEARECIQPLRDREDQSRADVEDFISNE